MSLWSLLSRLFGLTKWISGVFSYLLKKLTWINIKFLLNALYHWFFFLMDHIFLCLLGLMSGITSKEDIDSATFLWEIWMVVLTCSSISHLYPWILCWILCMFMLSFVCCFISTELKRGSNVSRVLLIWLDSASKLPPPLVSVGVCCKLCLGRCRINRASSKS